MSSALEGGFFTTESLGKTTNNREAPTKAGFLGSLNNKESACNEGDLGSIPELGRSPAEGHGNAVQYSCLENSTDRGAW